MLLPSFLRKLCAKAMLVLTVMAVGTSAIWAEGSKDFVNYPGYRMFLDTRDPQQLKVYAGAGEFINVGSSHVGIDGGFIQVYRPNGTLAATYDNTGASTGLAIINNNIQELAGPTGGGTTAGTGYRPGVLQVPPGQEGVWTIIFDYPSYVNTAFTNLLNNAPWTRANNQPNNRRVVLAWDVTVTTGNAGNNGGTPVEGRLYSNEHISLINGNGFNTSPVFYVLTDDGYLYQVNILDADPFRFPISSNSLGLVNGNGQPIYKSKTEADFTRDDDAGTWLPNSLYLYEPQAEDDAGLGLVNNKIFFNIPDNNMPSSAQVTDITRANTHSTWLFGNLQVLDLNSTTLAGASGTGIPCAPGSFQFGKGGYFIFDTNTGGSITLELDLNNNGLYNDPVDVTLTGALNNGIDSIFWNGFDGLGVPIPIQDNFTFNYQGSIRFGEIHIALTDVENNTGGVTFEWINAPTGYLTDQFYYDHSDVNGPVSGGGTPGNSNPTNIPYTYSGNAGNDRYLDQWFFNKFTITNTVVSINIVADCACENATPILTGTGAGDICSGQDLVMTAVSSVAGLGNITYNWSGPSGFVFTQSVASTATSTATVNDVTTANAGTYQVVAATTAGCADTLNYVVNVNPTPEATAITGGGNYCAGVDVVLTVQTAAGFANLSYEWTGPGVPTSQATGTVVGGGVVTLTLTNVQPSATGSYSLVLTSDLGCDSEPISTNISVSPTPIITPVSGGGSYCFDDDVVLTATNSAPSVTTMICTWNGPNVFNVSQTVNGGDPVTLPLNNVNNSFEGTYTLICAVGSCASAPVTFDIVVNANPEINAISPNGDFCAGAPVTLTALNVAADTGPLSYTWTAPLGSTNPLFPFNGNAAQAGPFSVTIPSLTANDAGTYVLQLTTAGGCQSVPQSVNLNVLPSPNITITGGGDACIGQDITLAATNSTPGVGPILFIWTSPNGSILSQGVIANAEAAIASLNDVTAANAGTHTISMTVDGTGCTTNQTVALNVLPGLNIENVTPDGQYCEFEAILFSANNTVNAGTLTYSWVGPNGTVLGPFTVNSNEPLTAILDEATIVHAGTWTLNVTSEIGCSSNTETVDITILPGVKITDITGEGTYCPNAPLNLSGVGVGSALFVDYTWTDPNGAIVGSGTTTPAGPFPSNSGNFVSGIYTLEVVAVGSGCSDSETATIEYRVLPDVNILNNDTTICDNQTLELCGQLTASVSSVIAYTWFAPNGQVVANGTATGGAPFCNEVGGFNLTGPGNYTLVVTIDGCTLDPDTININLLPSPVLSVLSGGGSYCEGEVAQICFTNTNPNVVGFFYTCELADGTQITGQTNTNETICIDVPIAGEFCCSLESFQGCVSNLECTTITYVPSAVLTASSNSPVCANDTLLLTGSNSLACTGTISYAWNGPNNYTFVGTAPCGGPFPANVVNPVSGVYCLIAPLSSTCPDTACVTVVVNPVPFVVNNTISGGGEYCEGEEVVLSGTVSIADNTPITFTWTLDGTPIPGQTGTVPSGTTLTLDLGQIEEDEEGEYCLELVSTNGCVNEPPTCTQVTVNPTPEIETVTGGGTYCEGVDVSLSGTGVSGLGNVTYMWMGPNGFVFNGGPVPSQGPFPATINDIAVAGEGEYMLIVKLGDCADTATVVVNVNPKPIITVISGNETTCLDSDIEISFSIDPNGASSVNWNFDCPFFDTSGTVTTLTTITFTLNVDGTFTGTITAESSDGCEAEPQQIQVTVQEIPTPVITASTNVLCEGDALTLSTTPQTGTSVSYEWFKDGVSIGTTSVPTFNVVPPAPGSYTVTVTVDGCDATSEPTVVTSPAAPLANDDTYNSTTITPVSGNVTDNDETSTGVIATLLDGPVPGLVFNPDGTFTYTPGTPALPEVTFNYEICLEDCPEECSEATVTITFVVECIIPNIMTPNGDNVNDVLQVDCLEGNAFPNNRLRVFNRWGDEIQAFEPYENNWDGTYGSDKKAVPAATYFYLLELDKNAGSGDDNVRSGYIKVVR